MIRALILGIAASFFFAFTFILNKQMNVSGSSWLFSSSLRYIFTLPLLFIILLIKRDVLDVVKNIIKSPLKWVVWSTVGFGLFYAPLSFAAAYGSSWLIAGTWQITIICGALMSPLFFKTVETDKGSIKVRNMLPKKALLMSLIILIGIFLMQFEQAKGDILNVKTFLGISAVIVGAISYPLGNRKMMELCGNDLNTFQRVFGMTLCSMPFWIIILFSGVLSVGMPEKSQLIEAFIVAVFSGIIATILFFKATDIVKNNTRKLAVIESTQSGEVIFTLLGGVLIFHDKAPMILATLGILLVVAGMILNSIMEI